MEVTLKKLEEIITGLEFIHDKGILNDFVPELVIPDEYSDEYVDYARAKNQVYQYTATVSSISDNQEKEWHEYSRVELIAAAKKQGTTWSAKDKKYLKDCFTQPSIPHLNKLAYDLQRTPDGIERQVWKDPGYKWANKTWIKRG